MNSFDLHPYISRIFHQTKNDSDITRERNFIESFFNNWVGEFIHPYGEELFSAGILSNSLFYCYLTGQATNFHWYGHSVFCGAYTIVFREFRCILEGLFIVFKIENSHHSKTLNEKLTILQSAEGERDYFGKAVFRSSGYSDWQTFYDIYKELSRYIHFSYTKTAHVIQAIKNDGFPDAVDYSFDKSQFLDACRIWRQMAVLAIKMAEQLSKLDNLNISTSVHIFDIK